uniref:Uncharacterized protein n=1 Tax=viral metagenome TaxID=1070528 RepID=A0A6C0DCP7_9ZZZZ
MSPLVTMAIAIFIVAALLFWQMKQQSIEGFAAAAAPVGGRPYGAVGEQDRNGSFLPADLKNMPFAGPAVPATNLPVSIIRPITVPGPSTAVRDPPATQKDLQELNVQLTTWLTATDQRENDHPGSLTPEQSQQRVLYEARSASILDQLGSGIITDTISQVQAELRELSRENAAWKRQYPSVEQIAGFGLNERQDVLMTGEQYDNFRGLLDAILQSLREIPQPDPLNRLRYQQLQVFQRELQSAERKYPVPPIMMRAARLFLQRAQRADQPLPTLFAMEAMQQPKAPLVEQRSDIIPFLPVLGAEANGASNDELRRMVADFRTVADLGPWSSDSIYSTADAAVQLPLGYDPANSVQRARTMCNQIRKAFPNAAEDLGCPPHITTVSEAKNVMGIVCDRLRYSVPTVSPAQFNCPSPRSADV